MPDKPITHLGRILSRGGKVAGLFIPFEGRLKIGIYDLFDMMGDKIVRFSGLPAMPKTRLTALNLEGVWDERHQSCMTADELKRTRG